MAEFNAARDRLAAGGPDGGGTYADDHFLLGHRRLAILDPTTAAAQPLRRSGNVLAYNGEVYNYCELRRELHRAGHTFRSTGDTEVVLAALNHWGEAALRRFTGMFALAWWQPTTKQLLLARDGVGIKPLYYTQWPGGLAFASELKGLLGLPGWNRQINRTDLASYLQYGYFPGERTVFSHVQRLAPGCVLKYDVGTRQAEQYPFAAQKTTRLPETFSASTAPEEDRTLADVLGRSCRRRLIADGPVGVLLSGGIDSSLLAATVRELRPDSPPPATFTFGFADDPAFDESERAAAIARHLGTDHHEVQLTAEDFRYGMENYTHIFDEPFGDVSGLAAYLLNQRVSRHVKCCLSGEGGDEVFGGYTKYSATLHFRQLHEHFPAAPRLLARLLQVLGSGHLARFGGGPTRREQLYKLSSALSATEPTAFFDLSSRYVGPEVLNDLGLLCLPPWTADSAPDRLVSLLGQRDLETFVPNDLLVKADRAGMANGLEIRVPYLDTEVIAFGLGLADRQKIAGGQTKRPLRRLLRRYLPTALIDGPKRGFTFPLARWLRAELGEQLEAMQRNTPFREAFGLDATAIAKTLNPRGRYLSPYTQWHLLVLHDWYHRWIYPGS